eukprot:gnl/Chilomastix_cuspidata/1149.p2 GENE.gnl/Chilomastix_cuspidata/1149~~gnl/Chilomastix_cuspidata/1149.p2  ORF type:complete len:395 (+),score=210.02 gnl/Chilomastix_cuspidata/1149:528-1712(+)
MNTFNTDPFYTIERRRASGEFELVYKSEYYKKNRNPTFARSEQPLHRVCEGDLDTTLKLSFFDWERSGRHQPIGFFEATVRDLVEKRVPAEIRNPAHRRKRKRDKPMGRFHVKVARVEARPSFLDYVAGGIRFQLSVAVDFTGSNQPPRSPNSLHYLDPSGRPTEYLSALTAVASILMGYTGTQEIFASGFGARIGGAGASHFFPLDVANNNFNLVGIPGLIDAYRRTVPLLRFSGPTNFQPTISHVTQFARQTLSEERLLFHVLLILTDGVITDMPQTVQAIVEASQFPLAIIIVGVGGADFSRMDELDADDGLLCAGGRQQLYDNVQFVPFRKHAASPQDLAREVLAELPTQVLTYYRLKGIQPPPPIHSDTPLMVPGPAPAVAPPADAAPQ